MINPFLLCDFYKISHREQYPKGTERYLHNLLERKIKCEDNFEIFEYEDLIKLLGRIEDNKK